MTQNRKLRYDDDPLVAAQTPLAGIASTNGRADDPMTAEQAAVLRELTDLEGEPFDGNLSRGQAAERIKYLRAQGS